jgi:hypothetical protein
VLTNYQLESFIAIEPMIDRIQHIALDIQKEQARISAALSDKEIRESNGMPRSVLVHQDTHASRSCSRPSESG